MSEKTEQPTSKRLRDARKKGQVAKSVDVVGGIQLLAILLVLMFLGMTWLDELESLMSETLVLAFSNNGDSVTEITIRWAWMVVRIVGILGSCVIVSTFIALVPQVGLVISTEAFSQGMGKLNPITNLKQVFSIRSLFELAKALFKIAILLGIFIYILNDKLYSLQFLPICGSKCALPVTVLLLKWLFIGLLIGYVIFASVDYFFQKRTITKQLMMTKEEVKQEYKDAEGNPEMKHRRREIHREIQHSSVSENVRKSSVIIRNPVHIAICIYFNLHEGTLPKVIEKASGERAEMIIKIAEDENIPMVENIPLARGLMGKIEKNQFITPEFFEPIAEILRLVMNIKYDQEEN